MMHRPPSRTIVTEAVLIFAAFATLATLVLVVDLVPQPTDGTTRLHSHVHIGRKAAPSSKRHKGLSSHAPLSASRPLIAAAITTSKRPDLFRRAYLSFRTRCLDCDDMIDQWFAVDDGSSPAQLSAMHTVSSDITWLTKPPGSTGHVSSLNRILDAVKSYDYLVFLEDDFFFVRDHHYVTKALDIFSRNSTIGQVVFNERYSLTDTTEEAANHVGGVPVVDPVTNATLYMLHEYVGPPGSPAWHAYFAAHPGYGSVHWPHFSLNSGVWRLSAMRSVGRFEARDAFEFFYGLRYMKTGYVTAFFPGRYSIHLGKPLPNSRFGADILDVMYARHGLALNLSAAVSAYDLNGVIR